MVEKVRHALARLGQRLQELPLALFLGGLLLLSILKGGLGGVGPNYLVGVRRALAAFPESVGAFSSSPGVLLLMKASGGSSDGAFWALGGLLLALAVSLGVHASAALGEWRRIGLTLATLAPTWVCSLVMLGHHDVFTVTGTVAAVLARRRLITVLGAGLALLGNMEQTAVAGLAALLVAAAVGDRRRVRSAAVVAGIGAAAAVALNLTLAASDATSRLGEAQNAGNLEASLRHFLGGWPLALWAALGGLWLLVAMCLTVVSSWRRRALALLGVLVIPVAASALTLDGTRVAASVSSAALATLLVSTWERHGRSRPPSDWMLGAAVVLALATPAIVFFPDDTGAVRMTYDIVLDQVGWLNPFHPPRLG
ncbi:MAG: hypothetical protein LCH66_13380 [Actinobacteria bacterium]|nr:hypothetical protein [Actinomycetota bacterium]